MASKMIDFSRNVVQARGYEFSMEEMLQYRIEGVYNSTCARGMLTEAYVADIVSGFVDIEGERVAIAEKGSFMVDGGGLVDVLSVILFADIFSMQLYVMKYKALYLDISDDKSFYGMFN